MVLFYHTIILYHTIIYHTTIPYCNIEYCPYVYVVFRASRLGSCAGAGAMLPEVGRATTSSATGRSKYVNTTYPEAPM